MKRFTSYTAVLLFVGAVTFLFSTAIAMGAGAGLINVGVTGGIDEVLIAPKEEGKAFYEASFNIDYQGGPVILSANSDGSGDTLVDDVIIIKAKGGTYTIDYSGDCAGTLPEGPVDISEIFKNGINKVTVTLVDKCGSAVSSSSLWITQPDPV